MPNLEHNIPKMFLTVGVVQSLQKKSDSSLERASSFSDAGHFLSFNIKET